MNKKLILAVAGVAGVLILLIILQIGRHAGVNRPALSVSPGKSSALLNQARTLEQKNNYLEARDTYQKLISEFPNSSDVMNWQKKSEELTMKLLFSPTVTPKSTLYEIKPGDSLVKIAREFKTTPDLIMRMNNMSDSKIIPGRKLKVWTAPFSILVSKSDNTLMLRSGDEVMKTYVVSTGKNNCTPVGTFKIVNKLVSPTWFKAGAVVASGSSENALGSRWMGFDLAGYGIHGTIEPGLLGKQATQGCVRLLNSDVEELYDIVPAGTEVTIVD